MEVGFILWSQAEADNHRCCRDPDPDIEFTTRYWS